VYGNHEKPILAVALGVPTACVQEAAKSGVTALADRTRAYIKIQDGCDAKCTYCIIPSVRPALVCRPPELILKEAQNLLAKGYKELVLTGVRLGRYVWKATTTWSFARLVQALVDLPGDCRIRLSSIEVTEIPDELIALAARHPKFCPFFHIPLQSGDNEILKRMGRWYTIEQYRERIQEIKSFVPDVALSADVIVGFAGETISQFQNTVNVLETEGFSRVHVFRYSVRPGTSAERLPSHVEGRIKSERARAMVQVDKALRYRYAERFLGRPVRVLVESDGTGYTDHYVRVQVNGNIPEGQFRTVNPAAITPDAIGLI
jgi:threonylcarbamoyladenosine tRNA methylthiotransferase MtaB